jgi:endonuclease/exonuclease/phosphatase family metal-dependent hydrolase
MRYTACGTCLNNDKREALAVMRAASGNPTIWVGDFNINQEEMEKAGFYVSVANRPPIDKFREPLLMGGPNESAKLVDWLAADPKHITIRHSFTYCWEHKERSYAHCMQTFGSDHYPVMFDIILHRQ